MKQCEQQAIRLGRDLRPWEERIAQLIADRAIIIAVRGAGNAFGIEQSHAHFATIMLWQHAHDALLLGHRVALIMDGDPDRPGRPDMGGVFGNMADLFNRDGGNRVTLLAAQKTAWYEEPEGRPIVSANGTPYETYVFDDDLPGAHSALTQSDQLVSYGGYLQPANQSVALSDAFQQPGLRPRHASVFSFSVKSLEYPPIVADSDQLDLAVNKVQLYIAGRRYDEALVQCHKLLAMPTDESAPWRGEVFRHIGVIARARGDFPEATDNLLKAEQRALESGDLLLRADVSEQLAELYWTQERHKDMLQRLNEAHSLYTQLKAQHRVAQVEKRNGALEARFLEMAKQWGDSIESKDRYTQGHCERVAFFACVLADSAGFNSRSLFWFRIGALLHDIGKIIVPTEVLNKPGKLTDEEWAIMKRHPEAGLELVADIDFPGDIGAIIRNHHERWDGAGYPDGLKGEAIPFAARILCVADVYDALTTTRSYRPGLTHARAAEIMRASTGQFDPDLLETFLNWAETADIPGRPTPQRMAIFASGAAD